MPAPDQPPEPAIDYELRVMIGEQRYRLLVAHQIRRLHAELVAIKAQWPKPSQHDERHAAINAAAGYLLDGDPANIADEEIERYTDHLDTAARELSKARNKIATAFAITLQLALMELADLVPQPDDGPADPYPPIDADTRSYLDELARRARIDLETLLGLYNNRRTVLHPPYPPAQPRS